MKTGRPILVILAIVLTIVISVSLIIFSFWFKYRQDSDILSVGGQEVSQTEEGVIDNGWDATETQGIPKEASDGAILDVFGTIRSSDYSNVVGYFAYGAFVVYVPDWIVAHWNWEDANGGMDVRISPKENPKGRDFSDIVIAVKPSTEAHNALWLYEQDERRGEGTLMQSETLFNRDGDMLVYHIYDLKGDVFYETYYIDGNGMTATVTFSANTKNYLYYAPKIKEFVGGLGRGKPQG